MGAEAAEKMARPGVLKTHLPFNKTPYSKNAKYICVARNPYDVCVSFYYHTKGFTPKSVKDVSFATFHELFISGKLSWGDYFDHVLSWYEQRDRTNVLFLTYEQAKKDTALWALKIADFLGKGYGDQLRKEPALLEKVLEVCSLENMRSVFNDSMRYLLQDLLSLPPEKALNVPGSKASKTADEATSAEAVEAEACGDDAGNLQCGDPWDTDPAAVALRLLTAEDQRNKCPTPAHATPAAKGAPSTYETALGLSLQQREPDQGLD
ncbi:hypothetical protein HPB49_011264 [Dermacentor silvarum]|uniref:Uncharacterized protein n=1 Tax=Dermacentor silvarum TaxID=543639 RepID=A0ACB8CEY7_DERSI|nr:hypothetical protein HPB49_011264 [Dermacentor silvarum]